MGDPRVAGPGATAVVGGGRMGEAIVSGLLAAGVRTPGDLIVAEPDPFKCDTLASAYGVRCVAEAVEAVAGASVVIVAVKPQAIAEVVPAFAGALDAGALVVSIAAGVTTASLEALLPPGTAVVRVMPNTPATVREAMSVISGGTSVTAAQVEGVREMFAALGEAVVLDEVHQNAATAISGSGPAYFARFADVLAAAGERHGLPRHVALELAVQTMRGTAALLSETGIAPADLVTGVSSPGGTTVAALGRMDEGGFDETVSAAVDAAVARARELGA